MRSPKRKVSLLDRAVRVPSKELHDSFESNTYLVCNMGYTAVVFFLILSLGSTVLFLGVPRGLLGDPLFQFLRIPRPDWAPQKIRNWKKVLVPFFSCQKLKKTLLLCEKVLVLFLESTDCLKKYS